MNSAKINRYSSLKMYFFPFILLHVKKFSSKSILFLLNHVQSPLSPPSAKPTFLQKDFSFVCLFSSPRFQGAKKIA